MKISYNWIKELVPGLTLSPLELVELLTMHSFETVIDREYVIDPTITVVKILKVEPHPNADRLRLATVTDGTTEIRVVCGAPNIAEGQVVPYAPPGANVYDEHGTLFTLTEAVIRGEKSPGMLNSIRELGVSAEHGGIVILPQDTTLGAKLTEYAPGDTILEVDVLPDRAHDALSHVGIAREVAALLNLEVQEPQLLSPKSEIDKAGQYTVLVEDSTIVPRFIVATVEDIKKVETPIFMQMRLYAMDARPVSPIVDITNYVMFEIGHPSHAFDQKKLSGKDIAIRSAKPNEKVATLDGKEYELPVGALAITSNDMPIDIGGVMGGADTEVSDDTRDILLTVATFPSYQTQETARILNKRTEGSARFSKGLSPAQTGAAAGRLLHLFSDITHATITAVADTNPTPISRKPILFHPARVSQYAGIEISADETEDVLLRLRFSIEKKSPEEWEVTSPVERLDVEGEHDIIDEVVRVHGLDDIPPSNRTITGQGIAVSEKVYWTDRVRQTLVEAGFTEMYSYSFEDERFAKLVGAEKHPHVELINPMAPELKNLRYSMLPGLLSAMVKNRDDIHRSKKSQERSLFEIGRAYHVGEDGVVPGVIERPVIAGIMVGNEVTLQETIDRIRELFNLEAVTVKSGSKPFATVNFLEYAGEFFGITYVLSEPILKELKYRVPVVAFEISLNALLKHAPDVLIPVKTLDEIRKEKHTPAQFIELPKYPSVFRDISLLVDNAVTIDAMEAEMWRVGKGMIVDVDLFDEYKPEGEKQGMAFHIEYRLPDKTLTDKEVDEIHKKIENTLKKEFDAEVR